MLLPKLSGVHCLFKVPSGPPGLKDLASFGGIMGAGASWALGLGPGDLLEV